MALAAAVLIIGSYLMPGVQYLYPGAENHLALVREHRNAPAVLITEKNSRYVSCVNSFYLRESDHVYPVLADSLNSLGSEKRIMEAEELLVYIENGVFEEMEHCLPDDVAGRFGNEPDCLFSTENASVLLFR